MIRMLTRRNFMLATAGGLFTAPSPGAQQRRASAGARMLQMNAFPTNAETPLDLLIGLRQSGYLHNGWHAVNIEGGAMTRIRLAASIAIAAIGMGSALSVARSSTAIAPLAAPGRSGRPPAARHPDHTAARRRRESRCRRRVSQLPFIGRHPPAAVDEGTVDHDADKDDQLGDGNSRRSAKRVARLSCGELRAGERVVPAGRHASGRTVSVLDVERLAGDGVRVERRESRRTRQP